jgi:hypothetical protein
VFAGAVGESFCGASACCCQEMPPDPYFPRSVTSRRIGS